jgi:hypothetical protein
MLQSAQFIIWIRQHITCIPDQNTELLIYTEHGRRVGDTMQGSLTTLLLKNVEQYRQACNETKWENKRESRLISVQNKQAIVTSQIRIIICTIRGSAPQAWPTKYKHGIVYARNLEISCNYCGSVTDVRPYGSTHPAPPLPRVSDAVY